MAVSHDLSPDRDRGSPHPAVSEVRTAVRRFLAAHRNGDAVAVACSGGADSLALVAATVHCAGRLGLAVHGLVVDHQLQPDSQAVAQAAAQTLRRLGCAAVRVLPITVEGTGGPEAAARRARYAALRAASPVGALVLLGHTLDDQAETVLLGLGRGSGPRSVAGMRELDPPWGRPLLGVRRAVTAAACDALGLKPWVDPHNADPRFRRVRLRTEALPLLEDVLAGGVAEALARTAGQLQEDLDLLDGQAGALFASARHDAALDVAALVPAPAALRRRVLRRWLLNAGVAELTDAHLRAADDLVGRWSGQGAVRLPGDVELFRAHGRLHLSSGPRHPWRGPRGVFG
ncbi:MAG TPA: tRNA lysidine(34) synthetase TilS [Pseudonocardiaceae bacterium]|nr:tRNA lysidine(34) synthetase TilS [Pseudonocardiaceae bacterium]